MRWGKDTQQSKMASNHPSLKHRFHRGGEVESTVKYNEVRNQIKDGDILLYKGKGIFTSGLVPTLVQWVTRSPYAHAGIAAWWNNRLMVVEAIGNGVIANPISLSLRRYKATVEWFQYKEEISDDDRCNIVRIAQEDLGKGYAIWRTVWFAVKILFIRNFKGKNERREENKYFCSEFVAHVYTAVGLDLRRDRLDRDVTPADIAKSRLLVKKETLQE
jgi:hypothetical protein